MQKSPEAQSVLQSQSNHTPGLEQLILVPTDSNSEDYELLERPQPLPWPVCTNSVSNFAKNENQ